MTYASPNILQPPERAGIMHCRVKPTLLVLLCLAAESAMAQDKPAPKPDDLDVTMQIITDPDAKLPDEVVRHIALPPRKPAAAPATPAKNATDAADKGQERAREAKELGREAAERARERAKEAAEQREQANRSIADERRRNPDPPKPPPPRRPR
jgi:hypothetical protein